LFLRRAETFFRARAEQADAICAWERVLTALLNQDLPEDFDTRQKLAEEPLRRLHAQHPGLSDACLSALCAAWLTASAQALRAQSEIALLADRLGVDQGQAEAVARAFYIDRVADVPRGHLRMIRDGCIWHMHVESASDYDAFVASFGLVGGHDTIGCVIPFQDVSDGGWPIRLVITQDEDHDLERTYQHERSHAIHALIGHEFARWEPEQRGEQTWFHIQSRRVKDELLAWIVDGSSAASIQQGFYERYTHLLEGLTDQEEHSLRVLMQAVCRELAQHPAMFTHAPSTRQRLWAEILDVPLERLPNYLRLVRQHSV
jgi:hypothetical protein